MANTININQGQSLLDIAIQYCGSIESLFDIAELNSISPTDTVAGALLVEPVSNNIARYYAANNLIPATLKNLPPDGFGIGHGAIGSSFKIG